MNTQYDRKLTGNTSSRKLNEAIAPIHPTDSFITMIEQVATQFVASLSESAVKTFNGRLDRGLELAKMGCVSTASDPLHPRRYFVRSTDGTVVYLVDLDTKTCECPDSQKGFTCKHRAAAFYFEQAMQIEESEKPTTKAQTPKAAIPVTHPVTKPEPLPEKPKTTLAPEPQKAPVVSSSPISTHPEKTTSPKTEEQLLKELGYESVPSKTKEPDKTLGSLYPRYLHGGQMGGEHFTITIQELTKVMVRPHPSQPPVEKWCLTVTGLPNGMPNHILFGARGEEDLVAIFGNVSVGSLHNRQVVVYPKKLSVAGQEKVGIRFRSAQ